MTAFMDRPDRNISRCAETGRWRVKIIRDGETHNLGRFDTIDEARAARDAYPDRRKAALDKRLVTLSKAETKRAWKEFLKSPGQDALQKALDRGVYYFIQDMLERGASLTDACSAAGISASKYIALARIDPL